MNRFLKLAACMLVGVVVHAQKEAPPAGGTPKDFVLPARTTVTLNNGVGLTFIPYGLTPKVTVSVRLRSGNVDEQADEIWLADLTAQMLKEGTATRSAIEVSRAAASMGGSVNVSVGPDVTTIEGDALSERGSDMALLLADIVTHPLLPAAELPRLKNDLTRQLSIALTEPQSLAQAKFLSVLYGDHPYGRALSTEKIIQGFTIDQVKGFYHKNYCGMRAHVYVAGKFDARGVEEALRRGFDEWQKGEAFTPRVPTPHSERSIYLVDRPGASQSTIYLGLPTINPTNPRYRSLLVMNALFGGSAMSRIFENIRERHGYTYSPYSSVAPHYRDAYWLQIADVGTNVTDSSLIEIFGEIERLQKETPPTTEVQAIENYMAGVFVLQNSSTGGIINQIALLDLHGLPETYLTHAVADIYAVQPGDIQHLAQDYLKTDDMTLVIVGDKKKIEKKVARFGKIRS
jgi:zinc protease